MDSLLSAGRVRFKSTVTVTGPAGVIVDEGVTVNNVDISRLLSNVATIETLVVPDPVTFTEPLTVGAGQDKPRVCVWGLMRAHGGGGDVCICMCVCVRVC